MGSNLLALCFTWPQAGRLKSPRNRTDDSSNRPRRQGSRRILYFGAEGSAEYWIAVALLTGFTVHYSWRGGLRSSLVTDAGQMLLAAVLLTVVLLAVFPPLLERGLAEVAPEIGLVGMTFVGLAAVQVLSYPFHDPVLTDRAFITTPRVMVYALLLVGLLNGAFILLFGSVAQPRWRCRRRSACRCC